MLGLILDETKLVSSKNIKTPSFHAIIDDNFS